MSETRILILRFSSLGDIVLATSLLENLRTSHPRARIRFATKAAYASLLRHDPRLERVEPLDERGLDDLRRRLEEFDPEWILDAHGSLRSRLLCSLLPPARCDRVAKDGWQRLLYTHGRLRTRALQKHQLHRFAAMLRADPMPARIFPAPSSPLALDGGAIAIAPGARHPSKQWPPERFARCAAEFAGRHGLRVLVLGSEAERGLCDEVATAIGEMAQSLAGQLELDQLATVLAQSELLLCNDSGLMHLAEAVGTPVMALFGPTAREFGFFPHRGDSWVVEHALPCRPCSRTGSRPCRMPERWCMTRSTVELVSSQLELQWKRLQSAQTCTAP